MGPDSYQHPPVKTQLRVFGTSPIPAQSANSYTRHSRFCEPRQSYLLNRSVVGYFVANNTGLASPSELAAEVKLGIVGIGWNLNHLATSKTGGLAQC